MTKGTPSFGKHNKVTHMRCRRCGAHAYHMTKKMCARCGFPHPRLRFFNWMWKHPLTKERMR